MLNIRLYANGIGDRNLNAARPYALDQIFGGGQRNAFPSAGSISTFDASEATALGDG